MTLADRHGLEWLSMRKLADELGVAAMSLYYYVPNKVQLIDGMIDIVFSEIEPPSTRPRLEDGDAPPGRLDPRGAQPPPLGGRPDGGAHQPRAGEPPPPQRGARVPARGRLLARDDRPRLLGPGRLHLRVRTPGDRHVPRDARRFRGGGGAADGRHTRTCWRTTPTSSRWSAAMSRRRATTTPQSSCSASTSSSTASTGSGTAPIAVIAGVTGWLVAPRLDLPAGPLVRRTPPTDL